MITIMFGKPRAGKSTVQAWAASRALRGRPLTVGHGLWKTCIGDFAPYDYVLSNYPIKGAYILDVSTLGKVMYSKCLILIDEIGVHINSREYRKTDKTLLDWFCLHGHFQCDVLTASQSWEDTDRRIRAVAEQLLLVEKGPFGFSTIHPIQKSIDVDGNIKEGFRAQGFMYSTQLWRKRYYSMFDSFCTPELPAPQLKKW